ncbi:MAG: T9SS type A sorting domain-containing protein [Bacteroidota bacterium]
MQLLYKISTLLLFGLLSSFQYTQAQAVLIYDADFSGSGTSGGASGAVGGGWSASGTDGCNDGGTFGANGNSFEITDYEGSGCGPSGNDGGANNNRWTTGPINIRNYVNVSVSVEVSGIGNPFENAPNSCSNQDCYDDLSIIVSGAASGRKNYANILNGRTSFGDTYNDIQGVCGNSITVTIIGGNQSAGESFFINRVAVRGERGTAPIALNRTVDLCEGESTQLRIGGVSGAAQISWLNPENDEITACRNRPNCPINQASVQDEGLYSAVVFDPNSGCAGQAFLDFEVLVLPGLPQAVRLNISEDVACRGQNINLSATPVGNYEYTWLGPDGNEITACRNRRVCRLNNVNADDAGGYLVQVVDPELGPCGLGEAENFLIVTEGPGNVSAEPDPYCIGQNATININVQNQGDFNYTWIRASDNQELTANPNGSLTIDNIQKSDEGLYLLIVSNEDGTCATEVNGGDGVVVIVNEGIVQPEIQVAETACEGFPLLRVDAASDQVVLWFDENNNEVAENTATYRPTIAGNYYAAIIDPNSLCTSPNSDFFFAEAAEPIVANLSASATQICAGEMTTITANGGTAFLWSTGATTPSIMVGGGNYSVTVSNADGCEAIGDLSIEEFADFDINISGATQVCANENSTLTASGGASYRWSSGQSSATVVVGAGDYSVTVTSADGCEKVATYRVEEFADFDINISGATQVCANENSTLTASGGASYRWSGGQSSATVVVGAGDYSVTVTSADGCEKVATYRVEEFADFDINISGATQVCANENSTLTASGGASYRWSSGQSSATVVVGEGDYSVTVTSADGCEKVATYRVEEFADFEVNISGATQVCANENSTLTASGGASYRWSGGQSSATVVVGAGDYSVTVTSADGCEKVETINITEFPPFEVQILGETAVCGDDNTQLTATSGQGYLWSNGATTQSVEVGAGDYSVTVTSENGCESSKSVRVIENDLPSFSVISTATCSDSRDDYQLDIITDVTNEVEASQGVVVRGQNGMFRIVAVPAQEDVIITIENESGCILVQAITAPDCSCPALAAPASEGDVEICEGENLPELSAVSGDENLSINWYDAPTGGNLLLANSATFTPEVAGTYYAETVELASNCKSTMRTAIALTINALPLLEVQSLSNITCSEATGTVVLAAFGDHPPYRFGISGMAFQASAAFQELAEGNYTFLVQDAKGCTNEIQARIETEIRFDEQSLEQYSCEPMDFGIDTTFLLNELGCDSLIITATLDGRSENTMLEAVTCDRNQAPTETLTFQNQFNCDSIVIINYMLLASDTTFLEGTTCNPEGVGERVLNLQNQAGCDSVVVINTTFSDKDLLFINNTTCDVSMVGIDTAAFINQLGCDSLIITTTNLLGTPDTTFLQDITCDFTRVGLDTLFLSNQSGCDSLIITEFFFAFPPPPTIEMPDVTTGCEGDSIRIIARPYEEGLQWLLNGEEILGATSAELIASASGTYSVTYTDEEGCTVASTDMVTLNLAEAPAVPVFRNDNNLLQIEEAFLFEGFDFQWFLDGVLIEGANESSYCSNASGDYSLEVTNPTTACSTTFTLSVANDPEISNCSVGTKELTQLYNANIYPNPYTDQFFIQLNLPKAAKVQIFLTDILGRVHYQAIWTSTTGTFNQIVQSKNLANGVYFLSIQVEDKVEVFRLIKGTE